VLSESPTEFGFPRQKYIWIDSVCINQKDGTEKNEQVSVMADIYQIATRVLVWIVGMDEFNDNASSALNQLSVIQLNGHKMVTTE
jgi:Heterokaryon incompatibility protein (HET)